MPSIFPAVICAAHFPGHPLCNPPSQSCSLIIVLILPFFIEIFWFWEIWICLIVEMEMMKIDGISPSRCSQLANTISEHEFIKSNQTFPQPANTKSEHEFIKSNIPTTCKHEFIKSNEWVTNLTRIYTRSEYPKLRKNKDQIKNNKSGSRGGGGSRANRFSIWGLGQRREGFGASGSSPIWGCRSSPLMESIVVASRRRSWSCGAIVDHCSRSGDDGSRVEEPGKRKA